MKYKKRGISLIALIITIAVLVIIAVAVIQRGMGRTDYALLAKHNNNISTTQEEVESYYYYKGGNLPLTDLTSYPIPTGSTLETEIIKNGEQADTFYVLDLSKLSKVSGKDGTGIGNDIYIVSATRHIVYYVKGTVVKGVTYHGLISKNDIRLAQITGGATPTTGATATPTAGATSTPMPTSTSTPTPTNSPTPTSTPTPIPNGGWDGTVNSPKLAAGMTPIKWVGGTTVDLTAGEKLNLNNEWYDYRNTGTTPNKWANVRLKDGSILVWIPRYTYLIGSGFHTSSAGTMNIRFTNGTADDTSGSYKIHPAFYWGGWNIPISAAMTKQAGGTEVGGIWVGKFEPSYNSTKIKIIPNATSLTVSAIGGGVNGAFWETQAMQNAYSSTYGILASRSILDIHMLKNSEWGATAYLSKYALGTTEVAINPNSSFITANGDMVTYKAESTTGNEYGIYDMNGCNYEYVAAYVNNDSIVLTGSGSALYTADAEYKDVFPKAVTESNANNYAAASQAYGFAIYETSSATDGTKGWFGDTTWFPSGDFPFFLRGGDINYGSGAGLFNFSSANDGSSDSYGFRVSCIVP